METLVQLDHSRPGLGEQLTGALRAAIADGRLVPGARLPSSRQLAADLRVSRGVVVTAYEQLVAEGRLISNQGSGTTVVCSAPIDAPPPEPPGAYVGAEQRSHDGPFGANLPIDLRPGTPDLAAFPRAAWRRAYERALAAATNADLGYAEAIGAPRVRQTLADYLGRVRAARLTADDVVVTTGAAQAFALVAAHLRQAGAVRFGVEEPGSPSIRAHMTAHGLRLVPIPVDGDGLDVAALRASDVQAVMVTPAHQYPTGVVLAPHRRAELIAWARETGGLVVEDDYDAEFRYDRDPVGCLQGLAPDVVAHLGSASKALAPALRLGWLCPPRDRRGPVHAAKDAADHGGPALEQLAFADLLATGGYDRHLRQARRSYRTRRDALVAALATYLPQCRVHGVAAGLHLVVELPPGTDDAAVAAKAHAAGLGPVPLSATRLEPGGPPGLVIGYASQPPDRIAASVHRLSELIRSSRLEPMPDFVPLAERIVDALLDSDPHLAASAGDHRLDGDLPNLSTDAVQARFAMLRDASGALAEVDTDALDAQEQVDHAILNARVERGMFELSEVREHEWNPLAHNPGDLIHELIARPFAPVDVRLESLTQRLEAVPDVLATARAILTNMPRIHVETAIGQFAGTAALVRDEVPAMLEQAPPMRGTVQPAADAAVAALDEFGDWLRAQLPAAERDPRLGRRLWEARLWHTLDTELTAGQVLERARENLERVGADLRRAAAEMTGGPATDETVREALGRLGAEHPDNATIVDLAKATMVETTDFVREHDLVTLVDDPCVIQEMPEFARGVAVAYCDSPGQLETAELPTFYCISPTPADWSPERVESFYREYNNHMIRNLTVHEAMPGHYLQLAHSRRFQGTTRVRKLGVSGPFAEGWAVYAEEVMAGLRFGGLPIRLQQLKMQLRMTINAILDQGVHCDGMTEADAMALMTGPGFQEEGEAAGKWRRALLTSTQLSTYFVGHQEILDTALRRPAGTSTRAWHDAMIAHGSPPPRHLPLLMGLEPRS